MSLEDQIECAVGLIRHARYVVALTGAGISTPSGIPDFRSPTSGLWEKDDPMAVASIISFRANPQVFYNWLRPMAELILYAQPNPAHLALAYLEQQGFVRAIITQNIDGLHQRAGSRRVLEVHGHMRQATCIRCYKQVPAKSLVVRFLATGEAPHCQCGGVFKPDAILFGEQLPVRVLNQAIAEVRRCDLLLVAGSSLHVVPAAELPFLAADCGAKAIIVNLEPTDFDLRANLVINADVAEVLPRIVELLPH